MSAAPPKIRRGLYVITDMSDTTGFAAGTSIMQLRNTNADAESLRALGLQFVALARRLGAAAVINDDPHLAVAVGADGVHLGAYDMPVNEARRIVGAHRIIGASCYASLQTAKQAISRGADYVAFGSVFPSATKPEARRVSLDELRDYKRQLSVPVCAIGGINVDNIRSAAATGVDLLAVIGAAADSRRLLDLLR